MKGLLFGGCSFTWGQGLYFYSDLSRLVYPESEYTYNGKEINDAHIKFKDTIRFPRLVANHFKTFEVFKNINGGSEDETFNFFKHIFTDRDKQPHISYEKYNYDDFEFMIIQLSQMFRNFFYYKLDGKTMSSNATPWSDYQDMTNLLKWMEVNNKTNDDWVNELKKQQIERLIKELNFYEEKGIKTLIFPWENEIINELKSIEFLNSRLVNLTYDNKNFDSIFDLQNEYKNMKIKYDYESFDGAPPEDHHPSKLCHEVIANSIIKHIENKFL
jgi:hypothetical protein